MAEVGGEVFLSFVKYDYQASGTLISRFIQDYGLEDFKRPGSGREMKLSEAKVGSHAVVPHYKKRFT